MPAATVAMSPARAKAARQKKIVIGGVVLLGIVLAIQGPKLMKQLSGSSTSSTPAPAVTPPPTVPGTPTPTTPVATAPTAGATTDRLASFETFSSKDPFIVQVGGDGSSTTSSQSSSSGSASGAAAPAAGTGASSSSSASTSTGSSTPAGGTLAASAGFAVAGSETTPPASPAFASASLEVNGSVTTVDQGKTFPRGDPVFKLASVSASSVAIGIADGSLKTGGKTVTVATGKQVTLQNTATGKRYRIKVVSTTPKG